MPDIKIGEKEKIISAIFNISVNVLKITGIKDIDMKILIKLNLSINWLDTRLTWMNLVDNKDLNILDDGETLKI